MISFIMMAKNVDKYIEDAVRSVQRERDTHWELIIVDDGSDDYTEKICRELCKADPRIRFYRNPGQGKVQGTNFGYQMSSGDHIKCIDSDDVLLDDFFSEYKLHVGNDVIYHDSTVVDEKLSTISRYRASARWMTNNYPDVLEDFVAIPKFSWSFSREVADKLFPMPSDLPFEDVWFSFILKKYARNPAYISKPLYLYRQHGSQTFGGILNFSSEAVIFRAKRILYLISILETEERIVGNVSSNVFSKARKQNMFLARDTSFRDFSKSETISKIAKTLMLRYSPKLSELACRLKWRLNL